MRYEIPAKFISFPFAKINTPKKFIAKIYKRNSVFVNMYNSNKKFYLVDFQVLAIFYIDLFWFSFPTSASCVFLQFEKSTQSGKTAKHKYNFKNVK